MSENKVEVPGDILAAVTINIIVKWKWVKIDKDFLGQKTL